MAFNTLITRTAEEMRREATRYIGSIGSLAKVLTDLTRHDLEPNYGDERWEEIFAVADRIREQLAKEYGIETYHSSVLDSRIGRNATYQAVIDAVGTNGAFIPYKGRDHCCAFTFHKTLKELEEKGKTYEGKADEEFFSQTYYAVSSLLEKPEFANVLAQAATNLAEINVDTLPEQYGVMTDGNVTYGITQFIYKSEDVTKCRMSNDTFLNKTLSKRMFKAEADGVSCAVLQTRGREIKKVHWEPRTALAYCKIDYDIIACSEIVLTEGGNELYVKVSEVPEEYVKEKNLAFSSGDQCYDIEVVANGEGVDIQNMAPAEIVKMLKSIYDKMDGLKWYLLLGKHSKRHAERRLAIGDIVEQATGKQDATIEGQSVKRIEQKNEEFL